MEFKGFTPDQQFKLLSGLGYSGPSDQDEMEKFMAATPSAAVKMGRYAKKAAERLKSVQGFNDGGLVYDNLDAAQTNYVNALNTGDPTTISNAETTLGTASQIYSADNVMTPAEATAEAVKNPQNLVTPANVAQIVETPGQIIADGTGQDTTKEEGTVTTVGAAEEATAADRTDANTYDASQVSDQVQTATDGLEAATADPTAAATVQGQLESLMADFEGGETPPWASGAMRNAMALMQKRGMGASSMAGMAVTQAAMESAIAIASQDASTNAQFEMQNLNNTQQVAIFKTQQTLAGMFSDQAADNAAKQFNAASQNQVDQFFADLESVTSRFNADQINTIMKFNAGEENAMEQFNESLQAQRDQFNASNDLVIAQANAQWRQNISTINTQAQNDANLQAAQAANEMTARAMDQIWQKERDIMAYAFQASENYEQRSHDLLMADKSVEAEADASKKEAIGFLAGKLLFG